MGSFTPEDPGAGDPDALGTFTVRIRSDMRDLEDAMVSVQSGGSTLAEYWDSDAATAALGKYTVLIKQLSAAHAVAERIVSPVNAYRGVHEEVKYEAARWIVQRDTAEREVGLAALAIRHAGTGPIGDEQKAKGERDHRLASSSHADAVAALHRLYERRLAASETCASAVLGVIPGRSPASRVDGPIIEPAGFDTKRGLLKDLKSAFATWPPPADWEAWAKQHGYSDEDIQAAIDKMTDADLAALNKLIDPDRLIRGGYHPGQQGPAVAMDLASWLFAHIRADQVDRLHKHVTNLEPGIGDGYGWSKFGGVDLNGTFSIDDVHQGMANDCWLMSALGETALLDPEFLKKNIKANSNGTFTVTLYRDGKPVKVTVSGYFPSNGDRPPYAGNDRGVNWVSIYEKARAAMPDTGSYDDLSGGRSIVNPDFSAGGGLSTVTGKPTSTSITGPYSVLLPHPSLNELRAALAKHRPITATTFFSGRGMVDWHVYMVVGVDGDKVILRNPWGQDSTDIPVEIRLPYQEFLIRTQAVTVGGSLR